MHLIYSIGLMGSEDLQISWIPKIIQTNPKSTTPSYTLLMDIGNMQNNTDWGKIVMKGMIISNWQKKISEPEPPTKIFPKGIPVATIVNITGNTASVKAVEQFNKIEYVVIESNS